MEIENENIVNIYNLKKLYKFIKKINILNINIFIRTIVLLWWKEENKMFTN